MSWKSGAYTIKLQAVHARSSLQQLSEFKSTLSRKFRRGRFVNSLAWKLVQQMYNNINIIVTHWHAVSGKLRDSQIPDGPACARFHPWLRFAKLYNLHFKKKRWPQTMPSFHFPDLPIQNASVTASRGALRYNWKISHFNSPTIQVGPFCTKRSQWCWSPVAGIPMVTMRSQAVSNTMAMAGPSESILMVKSWFVRSQGFAYMQLWLALGSLSKC